MPNKLFDLKQKVVKKDLDLANYNSVPNKVIPSSPTHNNYLSPGRNIRDINIPYAGEDKKQQMINPSYVSTQANQILENVSQMQKRLGFADLKIFESSSIDQLPPPMQAQNSS